MNCPVCREPMVILEYRQIEVDYCLRCKGCWLDQGELSIFLHGRLDPLETFDLRNTQRGKRRCPRCAKRMNTGLMADVGIEVDVCPQKHGIWFDGGELVQTIKTRASVEHKNAAEQWLHEVFGAQNKEATNSGDNL